MGLLVSIPLAPTALQVADSHLNQTVLVLVSAHDGVCVTGNKYSLPDHDEEDELTHMGRALADEDFKKVRHNLL